MPQTLESVYQLIEDDNLALKKRVIERHASLQPVGGTDFANQVEAWVDEGRVATFIYGGRNYLPLFQLSHAVAQPLPVIGDLLKAFDTNLNGWQFIAWLLSSCPDLDGDAPLDRLHDESQVVAAARLHFSLVA